MISRENLPEFNTPDGIKEIDAWVKENNSDDVALWIEQIFRNNQQAYPGWISRITTTGHGTLAAIVEAENDNAFRKKVIDGLQVLTDSVQWENIPIGDAEYVGNILIVIGSLKVQPLYDFLVNLTGYKILHQESLGERAANLHATALASLGAFGCSEQIVHIFERDIEDPACAALCYRVLRRYKPEYASRYADLIRRIGTTNKNIPAGILLREAGL